MASKAVETVVFMIPTEKIEEILLNLSQSVKKE